MSKIVEIKIDDFSGGISDDPREQDATKYERITHFDAFSNPKRLKPLPSFTADTNDGSTSTGLKQYYVKDTLYASASSKLYGLGKNGSGYTKIVYKTYATTGNWTLPSSSEGNGAVQNGCFVEYKDYLWGFQGTTQVWKWGLLSGTPSITNTAGTVGTITSVAQGIIGKDDNLYLPYNNKLVRVNSGGTVQDAVLTLPTNFKITSLANYGNYLAIACAPASSYGGLSKVFLWNMISSDVQEVIDWGEGDLRILENLEGMLVGVTDRYLNNDIGTDSGSMVIQVYQGGNAQVVKEVYTKATITKNIPLSKAVVNNKLLFAARVVTDTSLNSIYGEQIWAFGRKNVNYPFILSGWATPTASTTGIVSFSAAGNYLFVCYNNDGSVQRTYPNQYTQTASITTQKFDFGDTNSEKRLDSIKISFPLVSVGTEAIDVYYKVDNSTSWDVIAASISTMGKSSITLLNNIYADTYFKSGREFQFKINSVYGAEITGIELKATILNNP